MKLRMAAIYCSSFCGDKALLALDRIENILDFDFLQYLSSHYKLFKIPEIIIRLLVLEDKMDHLTYRNFTEDLRQIFAL
jgi:hypothetical protein